MNRKIKFLIDVIKHDIQLWDNFGIKLALIDFLRNIIFHGTKTKGGRCIDIYMYNDIKNKYIKKYKNLIEAYSQEDGVDMQVIEKDTPVWIFWWQGFEKAPEVVRKCVHSIENHEHKRKICYITKANYKEYVFIPDYLEEMVDAGKISITHFSDILRLAVLAEYGGVWMDSTLYMTGPLPKDIFKYPFYTIHHGYGEDFHIAKGKWTSFFLACGAGNPLIKFTRDFLFKYWSEENCIICYLLFDVIFSIAYECFPWAEKLIDAVPKNNMGVFELQKAINKKYDDNFYQIIISNSNVHKISHKIYISNNTDTMWNHFKTIG